jgi:NDP-sugar pyrophosphorylase family protein
MQVLILCGGRGTRLNGERPKPLIEIAGRPIVWHVVSIYAAQGFRDFLLLTGYKGDEIARWSDWPAGVSVECADTGVDTPTGGRVHAVRERLSERFCLTYADGVADIDLRALLDRHRTTGALATMTVVRPELPFGVATLDGDRVAGFREKPVSEQWVNGGNLGEPGSVAYLFDKKGVVVVDGERYSEDDLMVAIDAGAEDIQMDADVFEVLCEPSDLAAVRAALSDAGVEVEEASVAQRPKTLVPLDEDGATKVLRLIDALEEQDDVDAVHANFDVDAEILERVAG